MNGCIVTKSCDEYSDSLAPDSTHCGCSSHSNSKTSTVTRSALRLAQTSTLGVCAEVVPFAIKRHVSVSRRWRLRVWVRVRVCVTVVAI